jgi:hypothetical protein
VSAVIAAPSIFPRLDKRSPEEVKDYGEFFLFVDGGKRFRSDFADAYSQAWQQTAFDVDGEKRPTIQGFEKILSLYQSYAANARFGKFGEFRNFFGAAAATVENHESHLNQIDASIRRISESPASPANEVRFLGLVQEMIDTDVALKTIVQDRLFEITGEKDTKVDQGVIEFFDHAGNLLYLRLSLEYLSKMVQEFDHGTDPGKIDAISGHVLAMLIRTYSIVVEKRNFRDCAALLGHPVKKEGTDATRMAQICSESSKIIDAIDRASKELAVKNYKGILEILTLSVNSIQRLSATIDSRLEELGLVPPTAT